jgi:hypothetical protein
MGANNFFLFLSLFALLGNGCKVPLNFSFTFPFSCFVGLAYQGKDIVFRFIIQV